MKPMLNVEEIIGFNTTHDVYFYPGRPTELRGYVHPEYGPICEYSFITQAGQNKKMIINIVADTFYHQLEEYFKDSI
jgi:hypothetical protein